MDSSPSISSPNLRCFDPAGLRPMETVTPQTLILNVNRERIQNLSFVIREHAKQIRKTFTAEAQ
jgi:hypothetical protein